MPQICASGYQGPDDGAASTKIVCSAPPKNTNAVATGTATSVQCPVTLTPPNGAAAVNLPATNSICGYNQDNMFYCPWQLGDTIPQAAMTAYEAIIVYANANCNPASAGLGACKAVSSKFSNGAMIENQARYFFSGAAGLEVGTLIVNNAPCVKSAITLGYYGFSATSFGMIGALFAVLSMLF